MSCVGKACEHGKIDCNLTAQRVNNNEAHHLDNIIPYCVYCNTAMSNR